MSYTFYLPLCLSDSSHSIELWKYKSSFDGVIPQIGWQMEITSDKNFFTRIVDLIWEPPYDVCIFLEPVIHTNMDDLDRQYDALLRRDWEIIDTKRRFVARFPVLKEMIKPGWLENRINVTFFTRSKRLDYLEQLSVIIDGLMQRMCA